MDGFELNKIIAAILATVVVVFGINKVTDIIFTPDKPQQSAYKVEKIEPALASASNTGQAAVGISELLAMGTVEHGEKVFKRCSACHMLVAGGKNMIGPNLWSILGKKTGVAPGYKYSKALAAYGKDWTFAEMNGFLIKPSAHILSLIHI